ncbi:uncharacterized protein LOC132194112 [Neocloeon triangulifer]|uniref:uncharacterized protein LOC132194112 n=1 Tax=Neocloeon triangulifer TaxID=2078957 RepID=UPI00286EF623|nr:uncharacterized protein LOC132194112 [Neocloeon triangulifer]
MAAVKWEKYHQEVLIEKVRVRKCLWDIRHPDYRNVNKKQAFYEEVADEMESIRPGTSVDEVKKRWGNLRCQFSENIRASKGKDGGPDKPRKLWCKSQLSFLGDVTIPRSQKQKKGVEAPKNDVVSGTESLTAEMDAQNLGEEVSNRTTSSNFHQCEVSSPESCCFSTIRLGLDVEKQRKIPDCSLDSLATSGGSLGLNALNSSPPTGSGPSSLPSLRNLDPIDKYAHCVASELRQIRQPQQLILAKWHIQNILFQAQFGMLVGPPATLAFSSAPAPYPQDTLVNWPQSAPIQVIATDGDAAKGTNP